jgi:hypothetical protein
VMHEQLKRCNRLSILGAGEEMADTWKRIMKGGKEG